MLLTPFSPFSVADMFPKGSLRNSSRGFSVASNDVEIPGRMGSGKVETVGTTGPKRSWGQVHPSKPGENRNQNYCEIEDIFTQSFMTSEETRLSEGWKKSSYSRQQDKKSQENKHAQICTCGERSGKGKNMCLFYKWSGRNLSLSLVFKTIPPPKKHLIGLITETHVFMHV